LGYSDVEQGVMAGQTPKFFTKFARRIAIVAERVLMGEDPGSIPTTFDLKSKVVINQRTVNQIGVSIPFSILTDADVLFADDATDYNTLTLDTAVGEALKNNWVFSIQDEVIRQARADQLSSMGRYAPKLDMNLRYQIDDIGTANLAPGMTKQKLDYGFELNQLIFSDLVIKDIQNSKKQVAITQLDKATQELDITLSTLLAYLSFLKSKALLKVDRENLRTTDVNLDIARKRQKAGVAGPEEALRWEADWATAKAVTLRQEANAEQARLQLNQLMNHPQTDQFKEQDVGLETLSYYIGSEEFRPMIQNMKNVKQLLNFSVNEAYDNSPELSAIDLALAQQENRKKAARNRFLLPTAELNGELTHRLTEEYKKSPGKAQSDEWSLSMQVDYPLIDRGERFIDITRQNSEARRIQYSKYLKMQQIELDVRSSVYNMTHSFPSIRLTKAAMVASAKNYTIVEKKYTTGIASITDLTDAQRNKFQTEGSSVVAVYDFFADLASFDRSIAHYYLIGSDGDRKAWLGRLEEFINTRVGS
jgi:outer membrane protein